MATKTRLYKVENKSTGKVRLVETINPQRAVAHVASTELSASIPEQREIFRLATEGVQIEVAGAVDVSDETRMAVAQSTMEV